MEILFKGKITHLQSLFDKQFNLFENIKIIKMEVRDKDKYEHFFDVYKLTIFDKFITLSPDKLTSRYDKNTLLLAISKFMISFEREQKQILSLRKKLSIYDEIKIAELDNLYIRRAIIYSSLIDCFGPNLNAFIDVCKFIHTHHSFTFEELILISYPISTMSVLKEETGLVDGADFEFII